MTFSLVPEESKNRINKAGKTLIKGNTQSNEFKEALELANKWRACHAYPLNTFNATLRKKLSKSLPDSISAQRLKRMPTIIDKLKRYHNMQLTTMQDIGGLRAIVKSIKEVYKLADEYRDQSRFYHELVNEKDYIKCPRDEDGYRSLHLIYKYQNRQNAKYDGLLIELQIRTKLQHIWATAVETMGTFLGQALKSRQGDRKWIDFFAIISAAFACIEKSEKIPRFKSFSEEKIYELIRELEKEFHPLEQMAAFSVAVNLIAKKRNGTKISRGKKIISWYHLIILDSLKEKVTITPFRRDEFKKAILAYSQVESEAMKGAKIEPVLVSAGPINKLRRAYPNFFLDITDFLRAVHKIIDINKKT